MKGKQRLLAAMSNKKPDMVPISPDIDLIGLRWWHERTKKPWWEVFLYEYPTFEQIYVEANRKLDCDVFNYFPGLKKVCGVETVRKIIEKTDERIVAEYTTKTPYGEIREVIGYPWNQPPWIIERKIKDPFQDWPKLKWVMEQTTYYPEVDTSAMQDDDGITGVGMAFQGFNEFWMDRRGPQKALYDYYDYPEFLDEVFDFQFQYTLDLIRSAIRAKPEMISISASASSLSLISVDIYRKYTLPAVKAMTRLGKEAGILTHTHSCGKSSKIVEMLYNETDLNVMEPLEGAPTGDVDLKAAKMKFGNRICLKGNINTILLLNGTPQEIEEAVKKAIEDAGENGGFILATGDSPGSDTPDANIHAMVEAGRKYGKY